MQSTTQSAVHRPSLVDTRVQPAVSSQTSPCLGLCGGRLSRERAADSAVVVVRVARHDVHEVVRPHPAGAAAVRLGEHLPHLILLDLLANLRGYPLEVVQVDLALLALVEEAERLVDVLGAW